MEKQKLSNKEILQIFKEEMKKRKAQNLNNSQDANRPQTNISEYSFFYGMYKKLPLINFIVTMIALLAWGIIDWCEWITDIGDLGFGGLIIYLLIGAIVGLINMFFTSIYISPTIVRTDATISILNAVNNGVSENSKFESVSADELPDL